jgi:hypothetical protein
MHRGHLGIRLIRRLALAMAIARCLWPAAAAAEEASSTNAYLAVEQVRVAFSNAGFEVDRTLNWDWTSPRVSTFQVRDRSRDRLLMVLVYPNPVSSANGARLVDGFGGSVWQGNVALVQSTQAEMNRLFQLQNDRDSCVRDEPAALQQPQRPTFIVDPDFEQVLNNSASTATQLR